MITIASLAAITALSGLASGGRSLMLAITSGYIFFISLFFMYFIGVPTIGLIASIAFYNVGIFCAILLRTRKMKPVGKH